MKGTVTEALRVTLFGAAILTGSSLLGVRCAGAADVTVFGAYTRYSVTLQRALDDLPLTLHLGHQDGRFPQAWATLPGAAKVADAVDASGLRLTGDRLTGEIKAWVPSATGEHLYDCRYAVDLKAGGGKLSGSFEGSYAIRGNSLVFETDRMVLEPEEFRFFTHGEQLAGEMTGQLQARARSAGTVEVDLNVGSVLSGGPSDRFRRVRLVLLLKDGRFQQGRIEPTHLSEVRWSGRVERAELNISDERLTGTVTAQVDADALVAGTYTFTLDGRIVGNSVYGSVASRLGDRVLELPVGMFGGVLRAMDGPSPDPSDAVLVLTFDRAIEKTHPLYVHVARRGGAFEPGAAFWKSLRHMPVDASGLQWDGRRLAGEIRVTLTPQSHAIPSDRPVPVVYAVDTKAEKNNLSGTYRCTFGERRKVSGAALGRVFTEPELRAANMIRESHDWPFWNGPTCNFAALPSGRELVDDLADARLVWKSEQTPPARMQTTRYGEGNLKGYLEAGGATGGGCSPVVADGRVYLYYFLPNGEDQDQQFIERETTRGVHVLGRMWSRRADDVVICIDAATGATRWKTAFPGEGLYFGHHGTGQAKGAFTSNVAVADGRAYVHTTGGKTYCLDARSGDVLWATEAVGGPLRVVADGVLVPAGTDLVGIDRDSGAELWRIKQAGAPNAQPVRWVHRGKQYVLAGNPAGQICCVEPRTGTVRWTVEQSGTQQFTMTVCGPYLLCNGVVSRKNERDRLGCYRISPDGAERLWVLDGYDYIPHNTSIASHDGYGYLRVPVEKIKKANRLVCVELATGKVVAKIDSQSEGASGYTFWADGRVIIQRDASHGPTPLRLYDAAPNDLRILGETWNTAHRTTASYYPILITHAIADGRIFIRGARGIFCYDLRRGD